MGEKHNLDSDQKRIVNIHSRRDNPVIFGCTRTSHKVTNGLSLAALIVDLFILYKLLYGLDCSYALVYDAISLFLQLAVGFWSIFTNRNQVFDKSITKQESNHGLFANVPMNGIVICQLHAASSLLRLGTLLVSHKRRIACRCMTIMACLCSVVYVFARAHPLSRYLYKRTCAMNAPVPGDDRKIGVWETVRRVKMFCKSRVCAHFHAYSAVSVVPILCLTVQKICSYDTTDTKWQLFACDILISATACVSLWLKPLTGRGAHVGALTLRVMAYVLFASFKSQQDTLNVIDITHECMHVFATYIACVAESQLYRREENLTPEERKTLLQEITASSKERKTFTQDDKDWAVFVLGSVTGLAYLRSMLNEGGFADSVNLLYAAANVTLAGLCVKYRNYHAPVINDEDVAFDELPEDLKDALETYKKNYKALVGGPIPWTALSAACGYLLLSDRVDTTTLIARASCLLLICVSCWQKASIYDHEFKVQNDTESHPGTTTQTSVQTPSAGSQTIAESSSTRAEPERDSDQATISGVGADTTRTNDGQRRIEVHVQPAPSRVTTTSNEIHDTHANAETTTADVPPSRDDTFTALLATLNDLLKNQEARDASLHDILKRQEARDASLHALLEPMATYFRERITATVADATSVGTETAGAGTQTTVLDLATTIAEPKCSDIEAESTGHDTSIPATESDTTGTGPRATYPAEASAAGISDDNSWKRPKNRKKRSKKRSKQRR